MHRRPHWLALMLAFTLCAACCLACSCGQTISNDAKRAGNGETAHEPEPTQARVELLPPGRPSFSVDVELARTAQERQRGLMYRKHLSADEGMLFLFEEPQQLTFWMRNTYVPLDMIFIETEMRVLGVVENAEPLTETSRFVPGQSQYVLEINAGLSREHGIGPGTLVRFIGVEGVASGAAP
jgi:uncharacterized membrane protein (UPF0127 family)